MFSAAGASETAQQIVDLACGELDMDHGGLVMIRRGRRLETVAATTPTFRGAVAIDAAAEEPGPFLDTRWTGRALVVDDLAADPRWPAWSVRAVALGLRSLLAVELASVAQSRSGVLALFGDTSHAFDAGDRAFAHLFARHAALAIAAAEHNDHLVTALDGRKLIGQAQGILMERYGLDDKAAFAVLQRYSQHHNLKLRVVAKRLVEQPRRPVRRDVSTDVAPGTGRWTRSATDEEWTA